MAFLVLLLLTIPYLSLSNRGLDVLLSRSMKLLCLLSTSRLSESIQARRATLARDKLHSKRALYTELQNVKFFTEIKI